MKNEMQTQATNLPATSAPPQTKILASDVVVPRLLLMQGMSDLVNDRKANIGDMVKNSTAEKLGDPEHPIQIIPLAEPTPTWIIEFKRKGDQKWGFKGVEPRNASNADLPWRFEADKDGKPLTPGQTSDFEWRRVQCLTLYALLPADIEAFMVEEAKAAAGEMPDTSKALTPVLVTFRSTGFKAGKEVSTFFTEVAQFKLQAWKFSISLGCVLDKNDLGTYYVFKVDRKSTPVKKEHLPKVEYWANIVASTSLRTDDTGFGDDDNQPGAGAGNF
jgi:hypothetical protein